jgi:hypothetical protein
MIILLGAAVKYLTVVVNYFTATVKYNIIYFASGTTMRRCHVIKVQTKFIGLTGFNFEIFSDQGILPEFRYNFLKLEVGIKAVFVVVVKYLNRRDKYLTEGGKYLAEGDKYLSGAVKYLTTAVK